MKSYTKKLTLIKRSAPMCPDCNTMQFILENEGIPFEVIDIAKDKGAVDKYDLSSVPVLLVHESEDDYIRLNGIQPPELIKEFME